MAFHKISEPQEVSDKKQHFKNLLAVALADGILDKVELEHLFKISNRFYINREELEDLLDNPSSFIIHVPEDKMERARRLYNLVEMMMIDGEIDPNEYRLCMSYGVGLGYNPSGIEELIKNVIKMIDERVAKAMIIKEIAKSN